MGTWLVHGGQRLHYESYGSGDRVLVYLHGLLLDSGINRAMARAVSARGYRVVLLDLLGHGASDRPAHASFYRMDLYAESVLALLDELGVAQAAVGGVSLGANVSLTLAARAPERVAGLVVEMPVLEWAVPAAAMVFVPLLVGLHYAGGALGAFGSLARRLPRTPSDALNSLLDAVSVQPGPTAAVLHGILVGPVAPTVEARGAITAPALVLGHPADLIHPLNDAANLVRQMPHARLIRSRSVLEMRLTPGRLAAEIAEFLDTLFDGHGKARPAA